MYMIVCAHLFIYITYDMSGPYIFIIMHISLWIYVHIMFFVCMFTVRAPQTYQVILRLHPPVLQLRS